MPNGAVNVKNFPTKYAGVTPLSPSDYNDLSDTINWLSSISGNVDNCGNCCQSQCAQCRQCFFKGPAWREGGSTHDLAAPLPSGIVQCSQCLYGYTYGQCLSYGYHDC